MDRVVDSSPAQPGEIWAVVSADRSAVEREMVLLGRLRGSDCAHRLVAPLAVGHQLASELDLLLDDDRFVDLLCLGTIHAAQLRERREQLDRTATEQLRQLTRQLLGGPAAPPSIPVGALVSSCDDELALAQQARQRQLRGWWRAADREVV